MAIRARSAVAALGACAAATAAVALAPGSAAADPPAAWQADPGHTGFAQATTFAPPLGKRWVRRDLGEDVSYPVIAEGRVFVTARGSLYALDRATGATRWSRSIAADGVAYDAGRVFAVDKTGVMQALSAATGELIWTAALSTSSPRFFSPPSASGEFVYTSSDAGTFGVRQADGIAVWNREEARSRVPPAVDENQVYTAAGCDVRALQRTVGVEVWHHPGGCFDSTFGGVVAGARIYAGAANQGVVLDPLTGSLIDSYAAGSPPSLAKGVGYFIGEGGLFARSEQSGIVQWRHATDQGIATPLLVAGGYVYALDGHGKLVALAAGSGQAVWDRALQLGLPVDEKAKWPGMAAAGDTLVVSAMGRVTAFSPGPDTPGVDDPDKPSGAGAKLTLTASRKLTFFGGSVVLSGKLEGPNGGFSGAIEIQADPWPYGSFEHLKTVHSTYGDFTTRVKPDRNTLYRAVHTGTNPGLQSATREVFSDFFEHFTVRGRGRRSVLVQIAVAGPPDLKLAGRLIFVYHYRRGARTAVRIGTRRLRRQGTGAHVKAVLRTPPLRPSDIFFTCLHEPRDDGFGRPAKILRRCGRRRL
jgi:outer membrane protein assembly factor BamB